MKRILYTALFILLTAMAVKAQTSAGSNISINVSATVVTNSPIELTTLSNMKLSASSLLESEIYISPVSSPDAGLMLVKGRPGLQARLTYRITETITEKSGAGTIDLTFQISSFPTLVQRASKLDISGEVILNFGSDGLYYLWIGGYVNMTKAAPGKYTGQFTIEVVYI